MADQEKERREHLSNVLFGSIFDCSESQEQVVMVPLNELYSFKEHPFRVLDDEKMQEMVESILQNGVLVPGIARPRNGGGYEIIAGHRRKRGCELAGLTEAPFLVRNYSDDEAIIIMIDSNIQRENILPSEKAFAYRMKNEALKHQGKKAGKSTYEQVGEKAGDNAKTVQRYIRLTELIPELLELVDTKKLGFIAGAELSFLNESEQKMIYQMMLEIGRFPNVAQAEKLKKDSLTGVFDIGALKGYFVPNKKSKGIRIKAKWRDEFFEENDTDEDVEKIIYELLCQWKSIRG